MLTSPPSSSQRRRETFLNISFPDWLFRRAVKPRQPGPLDLFAVNPHAIWVITWGRLLCPTRDRSLGPSGVPMYVFPLFPRPQPSKDGVVPVSPVELVQPHLALPGPAGWTHHSFLCVGRSALHAHPSCSSAFLRRPAESSAVAGRAEPGFCRRGLPTGTPSPSAGRSRTPWGLGEEEKTNPFSHILRANQASQPRLGWPVLFPLGAHPFSLHFQTLSTSSARPPVESGGILSMSHLGRGIWKKRILVGFFL